MSTSAPHRPSPRPETSRRWTTVLLVVLLCSVVLAPLAAATSTQAVAVGQSEPSLTPALTASGVTGATQWQVSTPSNNSSTATNDPEQVRHRDPRGLSEDGDLSELKRTLAEMLASRLDQSSVAIEDGEYSRARSLLGDQYRAVLGRYVRVASETPTAGDNTDRFASTRDEQSAFVETVTSYREKRAEYEAAKRAGDEGRTREIARELDTLATQATQQSERLSREYDTLGAESGRDFSFAKDSLANVQRNISAEQTVIREAEFTETSLTVTDAGAGSFTDPVRVSGRLVDESETPLANRTVTIAINGTEHDLETNGSGFFSVPYRPVTDGLGEQNLSVEYIPPSDSVFLGSGTTATATISQVVPTVTVDDATTRASFGDSVVVSGSVAVDGRSAAGVPLVVSVRGIAIGELTTNATGDFEFTGALPLSVPDGTRQLRVAYPFEDRAFAPTEAVTRVDVGTTLTTLEVDGRQAALESLSVSGRLTTIDGRPVPEQSVSVLVAGTEVETFETTDTGQFSGPVWLLGTAAGQSAVEVVVVYDGSRSNLASSRASTRIQIVGGGAAAGPGSDASAAVGADGAAGGGAGAGGGSGGGTASGPIGERLVGFTGSSASTEFYGVSLRGLTEHPWFDPVVLTLVGVVLLGAFVIRRRRSGRPVGADETAPDPDGDTTAASTPRIDDAELPTLLVDIARSRLGDGETPLGIEYAYLGARLGVAARTGVPNRGTPRQFATACTNALSHVDGERFGVLTERYERAVFGEQDLSSADASAALAAAQALVDGDEATSPASASTVVTTDADREPRLSPGTGSHGD